ncbi:hypothetical protein F0L68_01745 [Solihabitans fulvus]|uniref:Uncharacterized protein n=1 Tax=Solihabitans fulvus TaxID=1892852 RepID=A0A5B2XUR0_9PSEU|nr:SCO2524 family protein [Solihabitans fulvus]KAA2266491.1 hypothetical protein F0L68_01745 [Solihabitans fulvus]
MRIQPRQHILDVWRSVVSASFQDGKWVWGGRDEANSISDAEQLLTLLYPATEIENLALDRPDAMADDVLSTLKPLGDSIRIPRVVIDVLADYVSRYTDEGGEPIFAGHSYLRTRTDPDAPRPQVTEEQLALGIVDDYSMSVTLCLAALGFIAVYKPETARRPELRTKVDDLERAVGRRLTAAMVGLLRSFVVNTVEPDSRAGKVMLGMVNQSDAPEPVVLSNLKDRLSRVQTRLRDDVRIGVDAEVGLDNENLLFECGWSWGIASRAAPIDFVPEEIAVRQGVAEDRPYLYFTVVALDGINDLRSQRTRELGLLDEEQRRLADALQLRWELTQRYWSTIARFGGKRWPLEDIPWRTSDGEESDYYSLLVSAVLIQDLVNREATDDDLTRAVEVLEELARRGRITSRVTRGDQAVALHVPGVYMQLGGSDKLGPQLFWSVADFAPLLLKRSLEGARLSANVHARDQLMLIAEATMEHLMRRKLTGGLASGLWDDPASIFYPGEATDAAVAEDRPSWYLTERVVEALVTAVRTFEVAPLRSPQMIVSALDLLNEADHLLNQELLEADTDDQSAMHVGLGRIEAMLTRARRIINERPSTANALALEALRELDELAVARLDASRSI